MKTLALPVCLVLVFGLSAMAQDTRAFDRTSGPTASGTPATSAGPTGPTKSKRQDKLQDALSKALSNSPQIRVAEAARQEAEARLALARMEVTRQVLDLFAARNSAKQKLEAAEEKLSRATALEKSGNAPSGTKRLAMNELLELRAQIARIDRELDLICDGPKMAAPRAPAARIQWPKAATAIDPWSNPFQAADDAGTGVPVTAEDNGREMTLLSKSLIKTYDLTPTSVRGAELRDWISKTLGVSVIIDRDVTYELDEMEEIKLPMQGELTGFQILEALSDLIRYGFVLRTYGIFVTDISNLSQMSSVTIPSVRRKAPTRRGR